MSAPEPVTFAQYGSRRGILWLKGAYAMFRGAPVPWLLLLVTYYTLMALCELGPWALLGQFLPPLLKPVFAVGFLAAAWSQERGDAPRFKHLFQGFRSNLYALLPLGLVFLAGISFAIFATTLVDDGALIAMMSGAEKPSEAVILSGRPQMAMLVGLVCGVPTLFALWFAPALVVFDDFGALRALLTSLRASFSNWRAILSYGLVVFALGLIAPGALLGALTLLNPALANVVSLVAVIPYVFVLVTTLQISDYVSYRDVFHPESPQAVIAAYVPAP